MQRCNTYERKHNTLPQTLTFGDVMNTPANIQISHCKSPVALPRSSSFFMPGSWGNEEGSHPAPPHTFSRATVSVNLKARLCVITILKYASMHILPRDACTAVKEGLPAYLEVISVTCAFFTASSIWIDTLRPRKSRQGDVAGMMN